MLNRPMRCLTLLTMTCALVLVGCDRGELPDAPPPEPIAEPEAETASAAAEDPTDEADDSNARKLPEALPVVELADLEAIVAETAERGQVLVIDFWATWCVPCVVMFPELHSGLKAMGDAVRPVTVTLDEPGDEVKAMEFLAEHDAMTDAYALVRTSEGQLAVVAGMGERWTDLVVPAILVYDRDGNLAGEFIDDSRVPPILERVQALAAATDDAEGVDDADDDADTDADQTDEAQARAHHH